MANLMRRDDFVATTVNGTLNPAASYTVKVYKPGGVVESPGVSGTNVTIPLYDGAGFLQYLSKSDVGKYVLAVRAGTYVTNSLAKITTITFSSGVCVAITIDNSGSVTLNEGDVIINCGSDTVSSATATDYSSGIDIYTDPNLVNSITNQVLTTDANGKYGYWHWREELWEVVRNASGTIVGVNMDITPTFGGGGTTIEVPSSNIVTIPPDGTWFYIKGQSAPTNVNTIGASWEGRIVTFRQADTNAVTFTETGNLMLTSSTIALAAGDVIAFVYDGDGKWRQLTPLSDL